MRTYRVLESKLNEIQYIDEQLVDYNESKVPFDLSTPFSKFNRHIKDENGEVIAGINCIYYSWKCLFIDVLWIKEEYRNQGFGSQLLLEIEQLAKDSGCHLIHLDTFDFQAKDFYLKQGYEIFGVLDECPLEHKRYYLKKLL